MSNEPRIAKLQELLARIQRRANEPRAVLPSPFKAAPSTPEVEVAVAPQEKPHVETRGWESPLDALLPGLGTPPPPATLELSDEPVAPMEIEPVAVHPHAPQQPFGARPEPTIQDATTDPAEVEAISGEYAVVRDELESTAKQGSSATAEEEDAPPLELEELGPAEETSDEAVVEIQVESPLSERELQERTEEELAARMESGPAPAPVESPELPESSEPIEEPPASGREIVAAPVESSRMKVAAPLKEEPVVLEPALVEPEPQRPVVAEPPPPREAIVGPPSIPPARIQEIEPPPETPRQHAPMRSAPAVVGTPSVPPPPAMVAPPKTPIPVAAPPEPALESVQLRAPGLPTEVAADRTVVALEAAVIKPNVTPKHVAAFIEAARAPTPKTFAELLDEALSL